MTAFNPKFLTKNEIDSVSKISDSAGNDDTMKRRLFDRNDEVQYITSNELTGTRTITFTPSGSVSIDRIYIQNCNWKTFTIKYDTSNDFSTPIAVTDGTATAFYFEFDSQAIANVVISITDTHIANHPAKAGQVYAGSEIFDVSDDEGCIFEVIPDTKQILTQLSDGAFQKCYVRTIVHYSLKLQAISSSNIENYRDLFKRNRTEPFVFIPRPITTADTGDGHTQWEGLANHYHWANSADYYNHTLGIEENGFNVNIELKQAAGV